MHKQILSSHIQDLKGLICLGRRLCSSQNAEPYWYKPHNGLETGIVVYNPIAQRKVPVILPNEHFVSWYTCGPTVYDSTHIGHASCYVKLDIIQRLLRNHFHLNLVTAMNITDIDDKIIRKSEETGKDWRHISRFYESEFWEDLRKLNVAEPNIKLRVSDHIPQIIAFIKQIMLNGFAYIGKDRSVYFDVPKYPIYGKLQKINLNANAEGETPKDLNLPKSNPADFALWKAKKSDEEAAWDSPWVRGRPGWHIECSTLASLIFGQSIDFHAGGLDLRFPHHENEEAQCCVHHNTEQWVNYWIHTGQLHVKGQTDKMSKSLHNTISVQEMLAVYSAEEFRMACALSNYRNQVDYSKENMETARNTLNRFHTFHHDCQAYLSGKKPGVSLEASTLLNNLKYAKCQIDACYKDDFDTARAISVLMDQISNLSRSINAVQPEAPITGTCLDSVAAVNSFVLHSLHCMGFATGGWGTNLNVHAAEEDINMSHLLEDILQSRNIIRERANNLKSKELFQICDELRNCFVQHGIEVRDHNLGSSWRFNKKK